ncbi:P-II family nitrogen regulator [Wenzhouxiangella sediminis]|uniref:P-II family nitrogen regulator n=1 Tax=Wenzhouxiangella sediminis TaxID=1792836 RepID=A0A3E1K6R5_9GAMM|nr:P-II family nitrogen regulator [Wenzhouxiangella sediminis]RFF29705.1 P-II family nitrogen regulator [Wenzhouxiangella sediminis]
MFEIKAYIRPALLDRVIDALGQMGGHHGIAVVPVQEYGHAADDGDGLVRAEMIKLEVNAEADRVDAIVELILSDARSWEGHVGDGIVTVSELRSARKIEDGKEID